MISRKYYIIILLTILIIICNCYSCGTPTVRVSRKAKILSINNDVLKGKTINDFLSYNSEHFKKDPIIVGIQLDLKSITLLFDVKLKRSEISYYRDRVSLPIDWELSYGFFPTLRGYLNNREIISRDLINLSTKALDQLIQEFKEI